MKTKYLRYHKHHDNVVGFGENSSDKWKVVTNNEVWFAVL